MRKSYAFALLSAFCWSTVATAFKLTLGYLSFDEIIFWASCVAFVYFLIVSITNKSIKFLYTYSYKEYFLSFFLGILNPFLYYLVLLRAYEILPAQLAMPINYLWPVMIVILSAPLLRKKLRVTGLLALFVSLAGVFIIASKGRLFNFTIDNPLGILLAAGSSVIWALFWIFNITSRITGSLKFVISFFWGIIFSALWIGFTKGFSLPSVKGLTGATYIGLFELGLPFYFWMKALQYSKHPDEVSNLIYISPALSLLFIAFILKEHIYYTTFLGFMLILAGIFIQLKQKQ